MVDTSVFQRLRAFPDYLQAEEEFNLRKQQQKLNAELGRAKVNQLAQGRDLPAAIQIANEIKKRVDAGDLEGANLIYQSAKIGDKGIVPYGADFQAAPSAGNAAPAMVPPMGAGDFSIDSALDSLGTVQPLKNLPLPKAPFSPQALPGYGEAVGSIEAAKKRMTTQAQKEVEAQLNPLIAAREAEAKLKQEQIYKPAIEAATSEAGALGAERGAQRATFESASARVPQLLDLVSDLSELGKVATYTLPGQARNEVLKQFGFEPTAGAVARKEYISKVDNEILPLLRETFGAAFTQKEGEELRKTLGDPNASPEEKDAVLRSFISTKLSTINTQARQLGEQVPFSESDISEAVRSVGTKDKPQITPQQAFEELKRRRGF